jgi:hypothetical protein
VECLATLVDAGVRVGVVVDGLQRSLGILELHLFVLVLLKIHLLFTLPLAGRRAILAQLLLLIMELFCKLLDFPALSNAMVPRFMHRALCAIVVAAGHLTRVLVISRATTPLAAVAAAAVGAPTSGWLLPLVVLLLLLLLFLPPP